MKKAESNDFTVALQEVLIGNTDALLSRWIALVEQDIADGWRAFYAREVWMRENLPAPLINDLGRALMVAQIEQKISLNGQLYLVDDAVMLRDISRQLRLTGYRNYLQVGILSLQQRPQPLDLVADATALRLLATAHRHAEFEIWCNQSNWYVDTTARCTLTPPLILFPKEGKTPVRDDGEPLALDMAYWRSVYEPNHRIAVDGDNNGLFTAKVSLALMAALAPDFPYAETLSTSKRLVFVEAGDNALAWAIMIDKTDGGRTFRYPPSLLLINRSLCIKLKDSHILFHNVLTKHYFSNAFSGQSGMELELRCHLPRYRRLIEVYRPYVEQALSVHAARGDRSTTAGIG